MKIVLSAFGGKMFGNVMDVPESTGTQFDMVLIKPLHYITGYSGEKVGERPPLNTRCTFEFIGKYTGDGSAKIYELIDIVKF